MGGKSLRLKVSWNRFELDYQKHVVFVYLGKIEDLGVGADKVPVNEKASKIGERH